MRSTLLLKLLVPVFALTATTLPAMAGPKEDAVLGSYVGTWKGSSTVSGPMAGPVSCTLNFTSGSAGKLSYAGNCKFGKGTTGFRGTMVYNDGAKRYETAGSGQGVSVNGSGKVSGGSITFAVNNLETSYGVASSTMVLGGSSIKLQFKLVDKKGTTAAAITFKKG
jgi:hypothetical protein